MYFISVLVWLIGVFTTQGLLIAVFWPLGHKQVETLGENSKERSVSYVLPVRTDTIPNIEVAPFDEDAET